MVIIWKPVENAVISLYYGRVNGCGNCKKTEPNSRETSDTLNSGATARNLRGRNGSLYSTRTPLVLTKNSADFLRERISVCRTQERSRTKRSVGPLASASRSSASSHFAPWKPSLFGAAARRGGPVRGATRAASTSASPLPGRPRTNLHFRFETLFLSFFVGS